MRNEPTSNGGYVGFRETVLSAKLGRGKPLVKMRRLRIVQLANQLIHGLFHLRRPLELHQHMGERKIVGCRPQIVRCNRLRAGVTRERHQLVFIDIVVNEGRRSTDVLSGERRGCSEENREY